VREEIIHNIRKVIQNTVGEGEFALHEPFFFGNEKKFLNECIDRNYVSSVGSFVDMFEKKLSEFLGVKHVVLTNSGTSALHSSLLAAGVSKNHEVLVPSLTFVATTNAILYCNATPHFIDSEIETLGINTDQLSSYLKSETVYKNDILVNKITGNQIKAILPVHTFGHACKIEEIIEIAEKYKLTIIEDAAEAIGSKYNNKHLGTFGDMGILSFNGNKTITTGAGGAIMTDNASYAKELKHITTTAKMKHRWKFIHNKLGYNYRMPNICAAVGLAQLENIYTLISKKRDLHSKYKKNFKDNKYVDIFSERERATSNYWFNSIMLKDKFTDYREDILEDLNNNNIGSRPCWELMHKLPYLKNFPKMQMAGSEEIYNKIINMPSSASIL
tara:strand:+ start:567 stop:1727 length:1161 start_codon:yes stop_codon:yes gene_type:complete